MSREKFTLLDRKYPENEASSTSDARVLAMKKEARELRDINNALVRKIWDLDAELSTPDLSPEKKELLLESKNKIISDIASNNYLDKVNKLLSEIEKLEITLYGSSEVNSDSPAIL